jgi:hypothetical protein
MGLIWDRAQHQGGDGGVHAGVSRREGVGAALDHPDRDRCLAGGDLGKAAQIWLGLHSEDLGGGRRVVGEVEAVAGADLQHPAGQAGQQRAAMLDGALGVHVGLTRA